MTGNHRKYRIDCQGTMAGVDINTLTMERYLALSRGNQASGVVKPEIGGNVNFEIKSQFMQELKEDTFFGNKNEDAHDHIDREKVSIEPQLSLKEPNPGIFTLPCTIGTMAGVDINTLTMERYLALSRGNQASGVVKPEIGGNVNFEIKSQFMQELKEDTFFGNKNEDAHDHIDRLEDIHNFKKKGDESLYQAWEWNVRDSSSNNDGIVALIDKMDNLGRDMKKLKESIYAIQVGCQLCEGPHLDKDCSLKEGVKQIEEAKLDKKDLRGCRRKLQSENTSLERLEAQIKHLTDELYSRASTSGQVKVEKVSIEPQLSLKEPNPGIFTLPCTIALDPDKDPLEQSFDEYKWVFHTEIGQLADEYETKIDEKGRVLEEIWAECKRVHCKEKECGMITGFSSLKASIETGSYGDFWIFKFKSDAKPCIIKWTLWVCSLEALTRLNSSTSATKGFKGLLHMLNATVIPMKGIRACSKKEASNDLLIMNAILWEFLVINSALSYFNFLYNRDIVQIKWGEGSRINT
nr:hypothetical protein [Tanacetum cinerariifolium]